jgi:hypothetical protein
MPAAAHRQVTPAPASSAVMRRPRRRTAHRPGTSAPSSYNTRRGRARTSRDRCCARERSEQSSRGHGDERKHRSDRGRRASSASPSAGRSQSGTQRPGPGDDKPQAHLLLQESPRRAPRRGLRDSRTRRTRPADGSAAGTRLPPPISALAVQEEVGARGTAKARANRARRARRFGSRRAPAGGRPPASVMARECRCGAPCLTPDPRGGRRIPEMRFSATGLSHGGDVSCVEVGEHHGAAAASRSDGAVSTTERRPVEDQRPKAREVERKPLRLGPRWGWFWWAWATWKGRNAYGQGRHESRRDASRAPVTRQQIGGSGRAPEEAENVARTRKLLGRDGAHEPGQRAAREVGEGGCR